MNKSSLIKKAANIAAFAVCLVTLAEAKPERPIKPHKEGSPQGQFFQEMKDLNLTEQQREQIRSLMEQARENNKDRMEAVAAERKKLRDIIRTDPVNPGAITAQTQRVAQVEAELNVARAQERAKMEAILTPEQRTKWKEIRDKADERAAERMRERIRERWEKRSKSEPNS